MSFLKRDVLGGTYSQSKDNKNVPIKKGHSVRISPKTTRMSLSRRDILG